MPTPTHEAWAEMVRADPAVAAKLLGGLLGVAVPTFISARLESADLTHLQPTEFHADAVVALVDDDGEPAPAIVVEVQRSCDPDKTFSWPVYLTTVRSRLRCRTMLVVLAPDAATARWCRRPIDTGHPDCVLRPLVVGPDEIPVVTDPEVVSEQPWLAVLSCLAHHDHEHRDEVLDALLEGTKSLEDADITHNIGVVLAELPELARKHLEGLMATSTYIPEFLRRSYAEGEARARPRRSSSSSLHEAST